MGRKPAYKLEMPSFRKMEISVAIVPPPPDFGTDCDSDHIDADDDDDDEDDASVDDIIDVVGLRGGNADSRGKTQSMRPLFKIMVPHPGQVVLGPIFTPRNNNNDEDEDDDGMEE